MMDEKIYYDSDTESHKRLLWWLYLMHGLSMIFSLGVLSFAPLIINYLKRAETKGSFLHSLVVHRMGFDRTCLFHHRDRHTRVCPYLARCMGTESLSPDTGLAGSECQ